MLALWRERLSSGDEFIRVRDRVQLSNIVLFNAII
jgi:hypothetical protein